MSVEGGPPHSRDWVDGVRSNTAEGLIARYLGDQKNARLLAQHPTAIERRSMEKNVQRDWAYLSVAEKVRLVDRLVRDQADPDIPQEEHATAQEFLSLLPLKPQVRTAAADAFVEMTADLPEGVSAAQLARFEETGRIIASHFSQSTQFTDEDRAFAKAVYAVVRKRDEFAGTPLPEYRYDDRQPVPVEDAQEALAIYAEALAEERRHSGDIDPRSHTQTRRRVVAARKAVIKILAPGRQGSEVAAILREHEQLSNTPVQEAIREMRETGELDYPPGTVPDRRRIVTRLADAGLNTYAIAEATGFKPAHIREDRYRQRRAQQRGVAGEEEIEEPMLPVVQPAAIEITDEMRAEAVQMFWRGVSYTEIGGALGLSARNAEALVKGYYGETPPQETQEVNTRTVSDYIQEAVAETRGDAGSWVVGSHRSGDRPDTPRSRVEMAGNGGDVHEVFPASDQEPQEPGKDQDSR